MHKDVMVIKDELDDLFEYL